VDPLQLHRRRCAECVTATAYVRERPVVPVGKAGCLPACVTPKEELQCHCYLSLTCVLSARHACREIFTAGHPFKGKYGVHMHMINICDTKTPCLQYSNEQQLSTPPFLSCMAHPCCHAWRLPSQVPSPPCKRRCMSVVSVPHNRHFLERGH
jgi:hypothetical protein